MAPCRPSSTPSTGIAALSCPRSRRACSRSRPATPAPTARPRSTSPRSASKPSCRARRRATQSGPVQSVPRSGCSPGLKYMVCSKVSRLVGIGENELDLGGKRRGEDAHLAPTRMTTDDAGVGPRWEGLCREGCYEFESAADNNGRRRDRQAYTGVFPIAPTPFTAAQDLDLDGMRRVLDCMIDQGVDGICILANYSEQFLLTDAERTTLLDLCLSHVAGRVPVIVTCSHYLDPHRGRARPAGRRGRREDADDDAALSRRDPARRRRRHRRAVRARRRGRAHADHGAGCAAERRDAVGPAAGAARARGAARVAISRSRCRARR